MYAGFLSAASNRADWGFSAVVLDPADDSLVDLTGSTITVAVRPPEQRFALLKGTNADGHITITGTGSFDVLFKATDMKALTAGWYDVGVTILFATGGTFQLFAGTLPVVDGVVDP